MAQKCLRRCSNGIKQQVYQNNRLLVLEFLLTESVVKFNRLVRFFNVQFGNTNENVTLSINFLILKPPNEKFQKWCFSGINRPKNGLAGKKCCRFDVPGILLRRWNRLCSKKKKTGKAIRSNNYA